MTKRPPPTRTWQAAPPAAPPIPQVRDPAMRAILRDVGRALRMIVASIDRHTGGDIPTEADT